jgi:hypothetical protein
MSAAVTFPQEGSAWFTLPQSFADLIIHGQR